MKSQTIHRYLVPLLAGLLLGLTTFAARALPNLQLGIVGGTYDTSDETIVTSDPQFSLVAYGGGQSSFDINDDYYISIALIPQSGPDQVDFGSFDFEGGTYDINNMVYGNPPIENADAVQPSDPQDLQNHGIFPTFYAEYHFNFDSNLTTAAVNTQYDPGNDPTTNSGSDLYYQLFDVDTSNLFAGYQLHFDLYSKVVRDNGDIDRNDFAPFSHDAATIPEPAPLMLTGLGLLVVFFSSMRRRGLAG